MTPWFSIIMPVYNVKAYLARCVQSVLSQSFQDYEILLVDDGSTDGSSDLCDELARAHSCIRVIHKENGGLSSARNAGMEAARGQYIWFVDSDDWVSQDSLKKLYDLTCRETPDVVKFDYKRIEVATSEVHSNVVPGWYTTPFMLQKLLDKAFFSAGEFVLSACTHIYKKSLLQQYKMSFISERIVGSEDYLFNLGLLILAKKIVVSNDLLYNYKLRNGSLTQCYKKDLPERYETLYKYLRNRYRELNLLEEYEGRLAAFYLWHLLRGTCIPNAYSPAKDHTVEQSRMDVREFLSADAVKQAYKRCEKKVFSPKQRILLWAMKKRLEPVFYWLYVVKPRKKGNRNENQA